MSKNEQSTTSPTYHGDVRQRRALWTALRELHAEGVSDQKIVDTLETYRADGRVPNLARHKTVLVSRATVHRVRTAADETLNGFRRGTLEVLYNFLRNCSDLPTSLYSDAVRIHSVHRLAPVSEAIQRHLGIGNGPLNNEFLKNLAGTFHLYRKAWTSIDEPTYIRCVMRFDVVGDAVFYTEEQRFVDTLNGLEIDEVDHGVVLPYGMNVVLLGTGARKYVMKFFSIDEMTPYPDSGFPVQQFSGNFIAVYSKGPHPGFGAFARRVGADEASCAFYTPWTLQDDLVSAIARASRRA